MERRACNAVPPVLLAAQVLSHPEGVPEDIFMGGHPTGANLLRDRLPGIKYGPRSLRHFAMRELSREASVQSPSKPANLAIDERLKLSHGCKTKCHSAPTLEISPSEGVFTRGEQVAELGHGASVERIVGHRDGPADRNVCHTLPTCGIDIPLETV